jgi:hypothetical protein
MQEIEFSRVFKSYNGKRGCGCGCLGRYTLPTHTSVDEANVKCGWDAYNEGSISDRRVKLALSKINKAIREYGPLVNEETQCYVGVDGKGREIWFSYSPAGNTPYVALDMGDRATTIYLRG